MQGFFRTSSSQPKTVKQADFTSLERHRLQILERRRYPIQARLKWNDTGLEVLHGERYRCTATGEWYDATICTGPAGYVCDRLLFRVAERFRRQPEGNWFALIGLIGRDYSTAFVVGESVRVSVRSSGTLSFFANDLPLFYGNNSGAISLEIEREG